MRGGLLVLGVLTALGLIGCHHPELGEGIRKTIKKLDYHGGR